MRAFADWFTGLGCKTLNDIRRLPRAGLKKRCGVALLDSLDRAYGLAPELYEWLAVPPAFSARIELPDRIEHAEAMLFSARRLIVQLCGWLSTQQLALTHATLTLEHERGRDAIDPTIIQIALAEPTWHEEHLVRLFKERLGRTELVAAVIAMRLSAAKIQPAEPPTETLFPEPGGSPEDHNRLLELLVARLGAENVLRAAPSSDHRPEQANRWISVTDTTHPAKLEAVPSDLPRPAWLLEKPLQLMMKNHRPFYGSPLKTVSPAERIEAGWFDGGLTSRDYFVAQANDQSCYWIYRERPGSADGRRSALVSPRPLRMTRRGYDLLHAARVCGAFRVFQLHVSSRCVAWRGAGRAGGATGLCRSCDHRRMLARGRRARACGGEKTRVSARDRLVFQARQCGSFAGVRAHLAGAEPRGLRQLVGAHHHRPHALEKGRIPAHAERSRAPR